jgi:hypothetical protein
MSRRVILILGCVVLLLLLAGAGAVGYVLGRPFPSEGGGQSRPSPDGKWVAHARTQTERSVVGGTRRFSELRIDSGGSSAQLVRRMIVEDTAEPAMDWRIEGEVFWARNSSAVTFKCVTGKANLNVTLVP